MNYAKRVREAIDALAVTDKPFTAEEIYQRLGGRTGATVLNPGSTIYIELMKVYKRGTIEQCGKRGLAIVWRSATRPAPPAEQEAQR